MNNVLIKKLKSWRSGVANNQGIESFKILHNKTIDAIAESCPLTKDDFLSIKGVGQKKFEKYGKDILAIIRESLGEVESIKVEDIRGEDQIYSVSDYLDILNSNLSHFGAIIRGEASGISFRNGHAYFSIKDKNDGSLLNCFMWARNYEMSGIELVEGMEVVVHGLPEVYKPYGKLTFRVKVIELVGEGALKKAYEELKLKLEREGLFELGRKKHIPEFPHKIGLITSRDGAVINDFMSNIGNFGYHISFMDSRVEGAAAIEDLIDAVEYFEDKDIDVLVIIRGGGSLESLQAFNNEMLVRKVSNFPRPVICGIGHDKDVPLLSYVADEAVSTPTAVAQYLNKSWEKLVDKLNSYEKQILNTYEIVLKDVKYNLEKNSSQIHDFYLGIFKKFEQAENSLKGLLYNLGYFLRTDREKIEKMPRHLAYWFNKFSREAGKVIDNYERSLYQNDPERQLKLGYSIVTVNGKIVKSVQQIKKGDILINKLSDGSIGSEVLKISN